MSAATDFVVIRFCTQQFYWMRKGHYTISPWLEKRCIEFVRKGPSVLFELPEELEKYKLISEDLVSEISHLTLEVKRMLAAISYTRMASYRDRFSDRELELMADMGLQLILK